MNFLIDHNLERYATILLGTIANDGWLTLLPIRFMTFRESVRIRRRFPDKQLHQVVIYLKETTSLLVQQTRFESATTRHDFQVLRLWEQPVDSLLNRPGLLPFAILGRTSNREELLEQIAGEIGAIANRNLRDNLAASHFCKYTDESPSSPSPFSRGRRGARLKSLSLGRGI